MATTLRDHVASLFHRYLKVPYSLHVHEFHSPKKPKATYVLIHGIGNTYHAWDEVVKQMPKDVRIIGIDLLGFGKSPKPDWAVYDAKTQARSVGVTLLGLRMVQRPIIVGHSLGALVAVEVAKRYPFFPQRLVLCSPPFYKPKVDGGKKLSADNALRNIYHVARKYPERLRQLSPVAVKLGLANKALNVTEDNVAMYMAALESSIINQTALHDVSTLKLPIDIFYGVFDPVVIKKHITNLAKEKENVTARRLNTGHEIIGKIYVQAVSKYLNDLNHV